MDDREEWVLFRRVSSDLEADMITGLLGDIPVYRDYPGVNQMIKIAAGNPQWVELYIPSSAWPDANAIISGTLPDKAETEAEPEESLLDTGDETGFSGRTFWIFILLLLLFISVLCIIQNSGGLL